MFYLHLREYGITGKKDFKDAIDKLLNLCDQHWRLLNQTYDILSQLANKCEISHYAITHWQKQGQNASKQVIEHAMKHLNKWLKNTKEIETLHAKWEEFKKYVIAFQPQWDRFAKAIQETILQNKV